LNYGYTYEELSQNAKVRQRQWAEKVHLPRDKEILDSIGHSAESGLPYGSTTWIKRLAKKLDLDPYPFCSSLLHLDSWQFCQNRLILTTVGIE